MQRHVWVGKDQNCEESLGIIQPSITVLAAFCFIFSPGILPIDAVLRPLA